MSPAVAANHLQRAFAAGTRVDTDFGLAEHPDKRQLFGNSGEAVEAVNAAFEADRATKEFDMLGVHYDCANKRQRGVKQSAWKEAHRRCKRIGQAGRSKRKRTQLIRMLVLPKGTLPTLRSLPGDEDFDPTKKLSDA